MSEVGKDPESRKIRFVLAQSIWRVSKGADLPTDADERKALWEQEKADELQKAMRLVRVLGNRGVTLSLQEADAEAEA